MSHRRICYCCEEECMAIVDSLSGPELGSRWSVVDGDISFAPEVGGMGGADYLQVTSSEAIILANHNLEVGNVGIQVTFRAHDRSGWLDGVPIVDEVKLIFDYHDPANYKYALVGVSPSYNAPGTAEFRQVVQGEDGRLSPLVNIYAPPGGWEGIPIYFDYALRLVVEPDGETGYYRASLVGPNLYGGRWYDQYLSNWIAARKCLTITSPIVGFGTGRVIRSVAFRNAYVWTPEAEYSYAGSPDEPAGCPKGPDPISQEAGWGDFPAVCLVEFDGEQAPSIVYWASISGLTSISVVWRPANGERGVMGAVTPNLRAVYQEGAWNVTVEVESGDGFYEVYRAPPLATIDWDAGITLYKDSATCFVRALACEEA